MYCTVVIVVDSREYGIVGSMYRTVRTRTGSQPDARSSWRCRSAANQSRLWMPQATSPCGGGSPAAATNQLADRHIT